MLDVFLVLRRRFDPVGSTRIGRFLRGGGRRVNRAGAGLAALARIPDRTHVAQRPEPQGLPASARSNWCDCSAYTGSSG